jgi:hypothetical protein
MIPPCGFGDINENIAITASIVSLNNPPAQKGDEVIKTLPCGEKMVSSKSGPKEYTVRSTFDGQKPATVALCPPSGEQGYRSNEARDAR